MWGKFPNECVPNLLLLERLACLPAPPPNFFWHFNQWPLHRYACNCLSHKLKRPVINFSLNKFNHHLQVSSMRGSCAKDNHSEESQIEFFSGSRFFHVLVNTIPIKSILAKLSKSKLQIQIRNSPFLGKLCDYAFWSGQLWRWQIVIDEGIWASITLPEVQWTQELSLCLL